LAVFSVLMVHSIQFLQNSYREKDIGCTYISHAQLLLHNKRTPYLKLKNHFWSEQ